MYHSNQNFIPANTLFGCGLVVEQHADRTEAHLPAPEDDEPTVDFAAILQLLRSALSR